ncbi:fibronectin-binding protein A [Staphylococcus aureus M0235]|nr:fibronectin-binding protein A [Staphylococcus aureus M0235]
MKKIKKAIIPAAGLGTRFLPATKAMPKEMLPILDKAQSKKSELPETGGEESTNKGMLFGGLFSILGLALLRRNKKNNKA